MKEQLEKHRILLVDDDNDILSLLTEWLKGEGFTVISALSGEEALAITDKELPGLVITDLFMDGMNGLELLSSLHTNNPLLPVIMLSGQAQIPDAIKATHLGCAAFLTKPIDKKELIDQIQFNLRLTPKQQGTADAFSEIIYCSKEMEELIYLARYIADSNVTVYISGATGTGKEILARAIHKESPRCNQPFVAINCGAIPEHLLESELFGHEKGAFTGAMTRHEGLFMAAHGGTIFLDEIGDMPLSLQVKLLRVLQDLEVRPVGSTTGYPIDVRIMSASHHDLDEAVSNGTFREDLYYRLKVVPIHLPTLEQRRDDIAMLAEQFLKAHAIKNRKNQKHFAPAALDYLSDLKWPGNIRQLMNTVELCATICRGNIIPVSIVKKANQEKPVHMQTLREVKQECEKKYLVSVMRVTHGQVANAARIAGRNRTEFYKLLNQHDLNPADFRPGKSEN